MTKKIWNTTQSLLLPLLIAIYPSLFYYSGNVDITDYPSLLRACLINGVIAMVVSIFFGVVHRGNLWRQAISASVFMVFFSTYGILYDFLLKADLVRIEHYTLLPLIILISLYTSWFIGKLNVSKLSRVGGYGFLILTGLVLFNLVQILPVEIAKAKEVTHVSGVSVEPKKSESINYPDIYYIVLDEFAGFEAMRQYWKYDGVDNFKKFLEDKNFFVAEQSHSESITTLYELATRLNYQKYSCCDDYRTYFSAIGDNRVMQFLKAKGYTTLAFDQSGSAFPTDVPVTADYFYAKAPDTYAPLLLSMILLRW